MQENRNVGRETLQLIWKLLHIESLYYRMRDRMEQRGSPCIVARRLGSQEIGRVQGKAPHFTGEEAGGILAKEEENVS